MKRIILMAILILNHSQMQSMDTQSSPRRRVKDGLAVNLPEDPYLDLLKRRDARIKLQKCGKKIEGCLECLACTACFISYTAFIYLLIIFQDHIKWSGLGEMVGINFTANEL